MELRDNLVLVTGASGFIGDRIVKRLLAEGARVRALLRSGGAAEALTRAGVEVILGAIDDAEALRRAVTGARAVVHTAGTGTQDRAEAMRINVHATGLLCDAALEAGCERFVHISTIAVHDTTGREVIDEETPLLPEGKGIPYEESKVLGDRRVAAAMQRGLGAVILRPCMVLGAHPTSAWGSLTPRAIAAGQFPLAGDGGGAFPYVHVDNLVDAVIAALRLDAALGQAFNLVDGQTTWKAYTDVFRAGPLPSVPEEAMPSLFTFRGRYASDRAARVLHYRPTRTFEDAMAETKLFLQGENREALG
jgi:nucleoside-diphosphate-sugar epimerase